MPRPPILGNSTALTCPPRTNLTTESREHPRGPPPSFHLPNGILILPLDSIPIRAGAGSSSYARRAEISTFRGGFRIAMTCSRCKSQQPDSYEFCEQCGNRLNTVVPTDVRPVTCPS